MMQMLKILLIALCAFRDDKAFGYRVKVTPQVDPVICESYQHGTKIPNPVDCASFYVCDRGIPEYVECTGGLLFDVNLKVCNWPERTTCVYGSLPSHKNPELSSAETPGSFEDNENKLESIMPADFTDATINFSQESSEKTNDGLTNDANDIGATILPEDSNAVLVQNPSNVQSGDSLVASSLTKTPKPEEAPSEIFTIDNSGQGTPVKDDTAATVPLPENNGHPVLTNNIFPNPQYPDQQQIIPYPVINENNPKQELVQCSFDGVYYLPHPTKCEYYYICISKNLHENYCGANLYWDYLKQRCDIPSASVCFSHVAGFGKPNDLATVYPVNQVQTVRPPVVVNIESVNSALPEFTTTTQAPIISIIPTTPALSTTTVTPSTTTVPPSTTVKPIMAPEVPHKPVATNQEVQIIEADLTATPPQPNPMDGYDPENVRCIHEGVYFLPHPKDCEVYFICINHTMHVHRCGYNVHWDYIYNQCSSPAPNRCYAEREGSNPEGETTIAKEGPENPMEGYDPEHVRCIHPGFYYIPHPTNCRVYFFCADHTLNIYQCTVESTWNYIDQYCSSNNDKCYFDTQVATNQVVATTPEREHDLTQILEGYDPDHIRCLHEGIYYLPHPTLCKMFFMCAHRTLTFHECSPGTVWNYRYERCDRPEDSSCFDSSYYRSTEEATTTSTTLQTAPIVTTTTTKRTTTSTTIPTTTPTTTTPTITTAAPTTTPKPKTTIGVHMPVEIEFPDKIKDNGEDLDVLPKCPRHQAFFPHSKDCRKYYICIGGVPILTKCPENLYWDVQQRMCGLPTHTKCSVSRKA